MLSGIGTHQIADELNARKVPTKKGGKWTASTVRGMIYNEKYVGDVIFQKIYTDEHFNRHTNYGEKDQYLMQCHHEPIISREDFEAAGAVLNQRRLEKGITKGSGKYLNRYPFSGKIICSECGGKFKRRIHSKNGGKYVAWCCGKHIDDVTACSMKFIRKFYKSASQLEIFDKRIARMPMNPVTIDQEIKRLDKEIKSIRTEINNITRNNNSVVSAISKNVIKYAEELGLGNKETIPASYLFTSNLKELSGAVLHKTAFAFRLAYITVIEDTLKIKLPIILDSPSGKEVDQANIKLMMDILKRDFADHQIIIASIFNYDFDEAKIIEIKERLITENSL